MLLYFSDDFFVGADCLRNVVVFSVHDVETDFIGLLSQNAFGKTFGKRCA